MTNQSAENDALPRCIFCRFHDEPDCWHSPEYEPVARAFAIAVHGPDVTDEQVGWFVDDAEQIAADLRRLVGFEGLTCRSLGVSPSDADRFAYLFNERFVVSVLGTNDGSGETIVDLIADLSTPPE